MISKRLLIVMLSMIIHLHVDARGGDLFTALEDGSPLETIKIFAEYERLLNDRDGNGNTPLHVASRLGRYDAAEVFLERGANIGAINNAGQTAQDIAYQNGHHDIAQLIEYSNPVKEPEGN